MGTTGQQVALQPSITLNIDQYEDRLSLLDILAKAYPVPRGFLDPLMIAELFRKSDLSPVYTPLLEAGADILKDGIKAKLDLDHDFHGLAGACATWQKIFNGCNWGFLNSQSARTPHRTLSYKDQHNAEGETV